MLSANILTQERSGNRCGHHPSRARTYVRPAGNKQRPSILEEIINALTKTYKRNRKFWEIFNHTRLKRSERRESIIALAQAMAHYVDLESLCVGWYSQYDLSKLIPCDLKFLAHKANLFASDKYSLSRAKRAQQDLIDAGYIRVRRQWIRRANGTYKGLPSIREFTPKFFMDLGLDYSKLSFARAWKQKKIEKLRSKSLKQNVVTILKDALPRVPYNQKRFHNAKQLQHNHEAATSQWLTKEASRLHELDPSRSTMEHYKDLLKR